MAIVPPAENQTPAINADQNDSPKSTVGKMMASVGKFFGIK